MRRRGGQRVRPTYFRSIPVECLALVVIVFGLLVTLTVLVARGAAALVAVDDGARELSADALSSASWLRTATDWLAGPGSSVLLGASMLALLVVLIRRRRFREMLWVVVAVVAQFAAEMVLTDLVARLPPDPLADTGYSFPSGHTASATVVLMLLLAVFRNVRVTWWPLVPVAVVLVMTIGASRVLASAHHVTDVVGGALLGVLVGAPIAYRIAGTATSTSLGPPTPTDPPTSVRRLSDGPREEIR